MTSKQTTSQSKLLMSKAKPRQTTRIGERLKGKALLEKAFASTAQVDESNRERLAIECGYLSHQPNGRLQVDDLDFVRDLRIASGSQPPCTDAQIVVRRGMPYISFCNDTIKRLGLKEHDAFSVEVNEGQIILNLI